MQIFRLPVGELNTNCYVITDDSSDGSIIIDPGGEAQKIINFCGQKNIQPVYLVNTHAHADHIAGNPRLKKEYPDCKIAVGKADVETWQNPVSNLAIMLGMENEMPSPDLLLEEGSCIALERTVMRVMETPGHTPGSISLLASEGEKSLLFCGDLVFADGVGRTDLPGGDFNTLQESITHKVFSLPENTHLYPGHGPKTTVAQAKSNIPNI